VSEELSSLTLLVTSTIQTGHILVSVKFVFYASLLYCLYIVFVNVSANKLDRLMD